MSSSSAYASRWLGWLAEDPRFHTNAARVENRDALLGQLSGHEGLNAESLESMLLNAIPAGRYLGG